jgi:hypothetical protein
MLVIKKDRPFDIAKIVAEVHRIDQLSIDLMMLVDGRYNVPNDAPIIDQWSLAPSPPSVCLTGLGSGHPLLPGNSRGIVTSDLALIAEDVGVARTMSRWYRLGRPAGSTQSS